MDGKPASLILDWINVEPDAIEVFNNQFGGRPVSPQNLSEWRQGGYREWLATHECRLDADAFGESSQMLGDSGIRADQILVFLTARWAKLIQQWGVMDPTQFSFAKHNLADLTKSAALLKKLELQTIRSEMDREPLNFLLKKKGGQPSDSDYFARDPKPPRSPFHRELPVAERLKMESGVSTAETHLALTRLHEHPGAPESETPDPAESRPRNPARAPRVPASERSEPPQTNENGDWISTPPMVSSPLPERQSDPAHSAGTTTTSSIPHLSNGERRTKN